MVDMNKQALDIWNAIKPMIDREIDQQTKGAVQRRKAKVTTAPSIVTKKIGVTEPFGDQYFIPYDAKVAGANVGDVVWVEYMYGASNAFASMFAKAVEDPRSCSATLSSAGWYRAIKYTNTNNTQLTGGSGAEVVIHITRSFSTGNGEETHEIKLLCNQTAIQFADELSKSGAASYIDKIRYTYKSGTAAYVDIHVTSTAPNVTCAFEVYVLPSTQDKFTAETLQSVADAPSGETVLTEYVFASNTSIVDVGSSGGVNHSYRRSGNVVVIGMASPGGKSLSQNVYTTVATLPIGLRPLDVIDFAADNTGGTINIGGRIQLNGNIELYPTNGSTSYWRFNVAYIV